VREGPGARAVPTLPRLAAGVAATLLGDPPVVGRPGTGVPYAGVEALIADQLALDVVDCGPKRKCHDLGPLQHMRYISRASGR
jgi:hypothetical protein